MTKSYVGDEITLTGTFKNSSGVPTDPTTVSFSYRIDRDGTDNSVTPVNASTGVYTATFTPDKPGQLHGYFTGTGTLVKNVIVNRSIFPREEPWG